jgi:hypothetical protein
MSQTVIRLFVVLGSIMGGVGGVLIAVTKLVPERAKLILGYQVEAIGALQVENKRLVETIARLEVRVRELEESLAKGAKTSVV